MFCCVSNTFAQDESFPLEVGNERGQEERDVTPGADRNVFSNRAETLRKGDVSLDFIQLIAFANISYGITDDTQASFAFSPFALFASSGDPNSVGFYNVSVKHALRRTRQGTLSVTFDSQIGTASSSDGFGALILGGPGAVYDLRLTPSFTLHGGVALQGATIIGSSDDVTIGSTAAGVFVRGFFGAGLHMTDWLVLAAEAGYLFGIPFDKDNDTARIPLPISAVLRFHGDVHAFEAGVTVFRSPDQDDIRADTTAIPLLNYTARF